MQRHCYIDNYQTWFQCIHKAQNIYNVFQIIGLKSNRLYFIRISGIRDGVSGNSTAAVIRTGNCCLFTFRDEHIGPLSGARIRASDEQ